MGVMEKSAGNAIFKVFPELLVWDFWIKTNSLYSQTTNKETNIFQSNFLKGFYLVPKCIKKKRADKSAIATTVTQASYICKQLFDNFLA